MRSSCHDAGDVDEARDAEFARDRARVRQVAAGFDDDGGRAEEQRCPCRIGVGCNENFAAFDFTVGRRIEHQAHGAFCDTRARALADQNADAALRRSIVDVDRERRLSTIAAHVRQSTTPDANL